MNGVTPFLLNTFKAAPRVQFGVGLGCGVVYGVAALTIVTLFSKCVFSKEKLKEFEDTQPQAMKKMHEAPLTSMVVGGMIIPIVEEVAFRGLMYSGLEIGGKGLSFCLVSLGCIDPISVATIQIAAVALSSLVFGLYHVMLADPDARRHPGMIVQVLHSGCVAGPMFGIARALSGGLAFSIGMHMGNNLVSLYGFLRESLKKNDYRELFLNNVAYILWRLR